MTRKITSNRHFEVEDYHKPHERGMSYFGFHNYNRKIIMVSHEPRKLPLRNLRF
ncbi:MAG: hypothetical protein LBL20_00300 [Treponema sp.]|nr:hypothetical protein [Treponema sp.]